MAEFDPAKNLRESLMQSQVIRLNDAQYWLQMEPIEMARLLEVDPSTYESWMYGNVAMPGEMRVTIERALDAHQKQWADDARAELFKRAGKEPVRATVRREPTAQKAAHPGAVRKMLDILKRGVGKTHPKKRNPWATK